MRNAITTLGRWVVAIGFLLTCLVTAPVSAAVAFARWYPRWVSFADLIARDAELRTTASVLELRVDAGEDVHEQVRDLEAEKTRLRRDVFKRMRWSFRLLIAFELCIGGAILFGLHFRFATVMTVRQNYFAAIATAVPVLLVAALAELVLLRERIPADTAVFAFALPALAAFGAALDVLATGTPYRWAVQVSAAGVGLSIASVVFIFVLATIAQPQ